MFIEICVITFLILYGYCFTTYFWLCGEGVEDVECDQGGLGLGSFRIIALIVMAVFLVGCGIYGVFLRKTGIVNDSTNETGLNHFNRRNHGRDFQEYLSRHNPFNKLHNPLNPFGNGTVMGF